MNRTKFYNIIICLLLISNFVLLYFALQKPRGFDPDGPKNIIIEKLHFDENQINSYQNLIDKHRKDIRKNNDQILMLKKELYFYLKNDNCKKELDSITSQIGTIQKKIEEIHFNHFLDIKALCKPKQLSQFDELAEELTEIFNHKKQQKTQSK